MAKGTLLLLTNPKNGEMEDAYLSDYLQDHFYVIEGDPTSCEELEDSADIVLVRNIWPTAPQRDQLEEAMNRWKRKRLRVCNPMIGRGDIRGKRYLCNLSDEGFPVIPSVDKITELDKLPKAPDYFIKPIFGGSSIGCRPVSKEEIVSLELGTRFVIQPFLHIESEISLYFLDGRFTYALATRSPNARWDLCHHTPSNSEFALGNTFMKWNGLLEGIVRIDLCRTDDERLFLMEIEDWCPFLSLQDLDDTTRNRFFTSFIESLKKLLHRDGETRRRLAV